MKTEAEFVNAVNDRLRDFALSLIENNKDFKLKMNTISIDYQYTMPGQKETHGYRQTLREVKP